MRIDFIGIGATKCATTTIARWLEEHEEICFAIPKEVKYFNRVFRIYKDKVIINKNFDKSLKWYHNHFNHRKREKILGEFSNKYLIDAEAPKRIKEYNPNIKLILSVRHPVDRMNSEYNFRKLYQGMKTKSLRDYIRNDKNALENGLYFKQLKKYLTYFQRDQIHIIFVEDLKNDSLNTLQGLYAYLGVDSSFVPASIDKKFNTTRSAKSQFMRKFEIQFANFVSSAGYPGIVNWLKKIKPFNYLRSLNEKPSTKQRISEEDRKWLIEYYRSDIMELEDLLNRDLSSWRK